jgi:hypothetical protein
MNIDEFKKKYIVNGKEYHSLEDVPPEFRTLVEKGPPLASGITSAKFEVNGKVYDRVEDMPPEYQAIFADKNGNGIPDILEASGEMTVRFDSRETEKALPASGTRVQSVRVVEKYVLNGKEYNSIDEVPQEFRKLIEDAAPLASGITSAKFKVNDKVYDRLEDMPPEFQAILADKNGNGIPDILEGTGESGGSIDLPARGKSPASPVARVNSLKPQSSHSRRGETGRSGGGGKRLALTVVFLVAIVALIYSLIAIYR